MGLKISSSTLLTRTWIKVKSDGIVYLDASAFSSKHRFRFIDIECILMSSDNTLLSFQAHGKPYSIRVKPDNQKHQTVIATFVSEVQRAHAGWGAAVR